MDLPDWRGTPRPQEGLLMKHESLARNDRRNQGGRHDHEMHRLLMTSGAKRPSRAKHARGTSCRRAQLR